MTELTEAHRKRAKSVVKRIELRTNQGLASIGYGHIQSITRGLDEYLAEHFAQVEAEEQERIARMVDPWSTEIASCIRRAKK